MKRKTKISIIIFFTILIIVLLTGVVVAVFTSYATTEGQVRISLKAPEGTIEKRQENTTKYFKAINAGETECAVRIKIFGINLQDNMITTDSNWEKKDDGYIYYKTSLKPGESTTEIAVNSNVSKVICIGEYGNAVYDENGNVQCDWNYSIKL